MTLEKLNKETLIKIYEEIKVKLEKWLEDNKPFANSVEYYKPILDFKDYENTIFYGILFDAKSVTKETFIYYHADEFINKLYSEYKEKFEGENALYDYIKSIVNYYLKNKGDTKGLNAIVDLFLKSYNDEPLSLKIEVKLRGIGIATTPLGTKLNSVKFEFENFNNNGKKTYQFDVISLSLRRPNPNDLKKSREQLMGYDISKMFQNPSAILEINMDLPPSVMKNEEMIGFTHIVTLIEKVLFSLKLFNVAEVMLLDTTIKYESLINTLGFFNQIGLGPNLDIAPFIKYSGMLKESRYKCFNEFLNKLAISTSYNYKEWKESNPMAYDMYSEAIHGDILTEKRITYAIIGLESLLSNSNTEVKYRLSMNTSKLISLFDQEDGAKILTKLKLAYDIRSDYAHGNKEKLSKDLSKIKEISTNQDAFVKDLLGYLSKSIIIILGISNEERDKFLASLETLFVTNEKAVLDTFYKIYIEPNKSYLT